MTPAKIAEMIEELPPNDQEKVTEYIGLLRFEGDAAYREYVLRKLAIAEEASARGEGLEASDARKWLLKKLDE